LRFVKSPRGGAAGEGVAMGGDCVLVEVAEDGVALVTLNRPEARNPLDPEVQEALVAAVLRLDADPGVRVAILTGAGSAFSAGGNLRRMDAAASAAGPAERSPVEARRYYRHNIQRVPIAFERVELPIVAAVNGPAMGAGCDLACMCDLRIASESARFAESFVKLGIIPGDGGAWLLPRVVGFAKAAEMALTGDALSAAEALSCGLVSRVVPDAELLPAARELAGRIAANPPQAVRMARRLLREAWNNRLDTVLEMSAAMQAVAHTTADHKEALAALREKRRPRFSGA
jgi:enoyl-CoA hydratase/carnithine racemase